MPATDLAQMRVANDSADNVIETHAHKGELRTSMIVGSRPLAGSDTN